MELPSNVALLVVDVQIAINRPEKGRRNNPQADENIARLLAAWREAGRPVFHVKDNSPSLDSAFHPSQPGNAIQDYARPLPGEPLIEKETHSAFTGTDLAAWLRSQGISTLVIAGFVTNHCVEATARMAGDLGFDTFVVSDATGTHDLIGPDGRVFDADLVHALSLANLHGEFATVVDTERVLAAVRASKPSAASLTL
jgi:nicotinamidase-related amidase